jgi:dsDNA-specific endonuclease/ATPase MutS2
MNQGDKVRLLKGKEEGIITRILDAQKIEVEIDGFRIIYPPQELVVVHQDEKIFFRSPAQTIVTKQEKNPTKNEPFAEKGIFLVYQPINETEELAVQIINNTDYKVLFTIGFDEKNNQYNGLTAGLLEKRSFQEFYHLNLKDFEKWKPFVFQLLFFRAGLHAPRKTMVRVMKPKIKIFYNAKTKAPLTGKTAYVLQIDNEIKPITEPEKIAENLIDNTAIRPIEKPKIIIQAPPKEVDLHIEKLTPHYAAMSGSEMFQLQIKHFEDTLERAISCQMKNIIFIHGVGNGMLKNEIKKRLQQNKNVTNIEEAQKQRFGYGATKVTLK